MSFLTIVNLVIFTGLLSFIFQLNKKKMSLSKQVLLGLLIGTLFGAYLQIFFGAENRVSQETIEWTNIVANSFVNLLRMIIIPLILVTMIAAVLKVDEIKSLGKRVLGHSTDYIYTPRSNYLSDSACDSKFD